MIHLEYVGKKNSKTFQYMKKILSDNFQLTSVYFLRLNLGKQERKRQQYASSEVPLTSTAYRCKLLLLATEIRGTGCT